jgi:hypothetical protein
MNPALQGNVQVAAATTSFANHYGEGARPDAQHFSTAAGRLPAGGRAIPHEPQLRRNLATLMVKVPPTFKREGTSGINLRLRKHSVWLKLNV